MIGGTIDIPKVGQVPKVAAYGIGAVAAGYVGWRWWQSRNSAASSAAPTDPGFEDPGTLPGVNGAVPSDGSFGGTTGGTGDAGTGQITTNSAWSNDALAKLTATGSYDAGLVAAALGNYLGGQPLSSDQQSIVRAAIAVSGYPPVGSFSIISGGDTGLTVAPSGLSAVNVTTSNAQIQFTGVPGATGYQAYRNGVAAESAGSSPITMAGLAQNTSYTVHVVAKTAAGKASPDSPSITFKTAISSVGAPTGLRVASTPPSTPTQVNLTWNPVANAKGYQILVNGAQNGNTVTYNGGAARYLKAGTKYTIAVRAVNQNNVPGPQASISVTTKKK